MEGDDTTTTTEHLTPIQRAIRDEAGREAPPWQGRPDDFEADPNALPPEVRDEGTPPREPGETPEAPGADEPGVETPGEGEGEEEVLVARLPGRAEDEPDVEIEVTDKAVWERLNQMRNGYERSRRLEERSEELQRMQDELTEVDALLRADPVNFVMDRLRPELQEQVALNLLAVPGVYEAVRTKVNEWDGQDDTVRQGHLAQLENERLKRGAAVRSELDMQREVNSQVRELVTTVRSWVPPTMDDALARQFLHDAQADLAGYAEREEMGLLGPREFRQFLADLPTILAPRLKLYGINPLEPAAGSRTGPSQPGSNDSTPSVARPGSPEAQRLADEAKATPGRVRAAISRRRDAGSVPGSDSGVRPATPGAKPPPGSGLKETFKHLRGQGWRGAWTS